MDYKKGNKQKIKIPKGEQGSLKKAMKQEGMVM